jgi:hypothetical protein
VNLGNYKILEYRLSKKFCLWEVKMMLIDWLFIDKDRNKFEVTIEENGKPSQGDGKIYDGKGYEVIGVLSGRTTSKNDLAIALEKDLD